MTKLHAPWTEEQVIALEKRQENLRKHPYTCVCGESLIPTTNGWECENCPYKQSWCYVFDVPKLSIVIDAQYKSYDPKCRSVYENKDIYN